MHSRHIHWTPIISLGTRSTQFRSMKPENLKSNTRGTICPLLCDTKSHNCLKPSWRNSFADFIDFLQTILYTLRNPSFRLTMTKLFHSKEIHFTPPISVPTAEARFKLTAIFHPRSISEAVFVRVASVHLFYSTF